GTAPRAHRATGGQGGRTHRGHARPGVLPARRRRHRCPWRRAGSRAVRTRRGLRALGTPRNPVGARRARDAVSRVLTLERRSALANVPRPGLRPGLLLDFAKAHHLSRDAPHVSGRFAVASRSVSARDSFARKARSYG